jgi:hypothetical protein
VSNSPPKSDFESESSRLNEGLKSCRAVLKNYRAMMSRKQPPDPGEDTIDPASLASATESASGT